MIADIRARVAPEFTWGIRPRRQLRKDLVQHPRRLGRFDENQVEPGKKLLEFTDALDDRCPDLVRKSTPPGREGCQAIAPVDMLVDMGPTGRARRGTTLNLDGLDDRPVRLLTERKEPEDILTFGKPSHDGGNLARRSVECLG